MRIPRKIDTSLRGRMADAETAFDAGAYLSAISLALTIPDICGDRLYPNSKSSTRYVKWFDEYVAPSYIDGLGDGGGEPSSTTKFYLSGGDCYQLRCVYLHQGINAPSKPKKTVYNAIQFTVSEDVGAACDHVCETWEDADGSMFRRIDLDLRKFIRSLRAGVENFLQEYPEANEDNGSDDWFYNPVLDFKNGRELG